MPTIFPTSSKVLLLQKPSNATPPRTHVNNTTNGLYTGIGMTPARAGADDHKQHGSLGLRAQIKVRTV